jgi:hypothetical protein
MGCHEHNLWGQINSSSSVFKKKAGASGYSGNVIGEDFVQSWLNS